MIVMKLLSVTLALIALVAAVLEARGAGGFPLATLIARWYPRPRNQAVTMLAGFALGGALVLLPTAIHVGRSDAELTYLAATTPLWLVLAVGSLLIKAAFVFFEEVVFRGAVITLLRRYMAWPVAVVLAAAVFSLAHPDRSPASLVILGMDGMLLGTSFVSTDSLWLPSAIHIGKNLTVWLIEGGGTLTLVPGLFGLTHTTTGPLELGTTLGLVVTASFVMVKARALRDRDCDPPPPRGD